MNECKNCVKNENKEHLDIFNSNETKEKILAENTSHSCVGITHEKLVTIKFEATFNCTVCGEQILDEDIYNRHMTIHLNESCNANIGNIKIEQTVMSSPIIANSRSFSDSAFNSEIKYELMKESTTEVQVTVKKTTNAERCKKYREKKKSMKIIQKESAIKVPLKKLNNAKNCKKYYERQKLKKKQIELQQQNAEHSTSMEVSGTKVKQSAAEYMKKYRQRLKLQKQSILLNTLLAKHSHVKKENMSDMQH